MPPFAYMLTWVTYGSWLAGDDRGSLRARIGYEPPNAPLREHHLSLLKHNVVSLCPTSREVVLDAIVSTCSTRGWELRAAHVRIQHVHAVIRTNDPAERVCASLKAWGTRRLREAGLVQAEERVWAQRADIKYLWDEDACSAAAEYVYSRQGEVMARYPRE